MALTNWDAFHIYVLPKVPGAPEPIVDEAIREAAREFCERTRLHKHTVSVAVGTGATVTPIPPTDTEICHVMFARIGTKKIVPETEDRLREMYGSDWMERTGESEYIVGDTEDIFRLVPYLGVANTQQLTLRVALRPTEAAAGLEEWIYKRHQRVISHRALSILMGSPETLPYSNPPQSAAYKQAFDEAVGRIRKEAYRGHTRAKVRSRPIFF